MMKRICAILLIFIMAVTFTSCKKENKKEETNELKQNFDIKIATNIIDTYMTYLIKEDLESGKKLYSQELLKKQKGVYETNLKVSGYKIDEVNEVGKSALFKVKVSKSTPNSPAATLDVYNIKIEKENDEYLISEINSMTEKDAFFEDDGIRIRDKNNVKTNLLIDKTGIPQFAYPKDDSAKVNKIEVPKNKFGIMGFAFSGERIAITTEEKDSYVGLVKIDESLSVQGGSSGGSGSGGGGEAGGGKQQGAGASNTKARETPIGKEITSVDIIKDGKIDLLAFSLDEKFILAQYTKNNLGTNVRVYDTDSGELIKVNFEEKFPLGKVDVKFSSFSKEALNIEVVERKGTGKEQADLLGKWQVDLKKYTLTKI
jgi:uncharacterized membrane protein YgcG